MVKAEKKLSSVSHIVPTNNDDISEIIKSRQTDELILSFCGPVGSQVTEIAKNVIDVLEDYRYDVGRIEISQYLKDVYPTVKDEILETTWVQNINFKQDINEMPYAHKTDVLQSVGNLLRKGHNPSILAQIAISAIGLHRRAQERQSLHSQRGHDDEIKQPQPRRFAIIIDSLKHPDEVALLQAVYGEMFYLIGVLCPQNRRKYWLEKEKRVSGPDAEYLMKRDKSEKDSFGQQVLKTLEHADFFVRNVGGNIESSKNTVRRYIDIILGNIDRAPTIDEYAMFSAQSSAYRSVCLSRQVGAAIIDEKGNLISTGYNETPKFQGGHYTAFDRNDNRCIKLSGGKCANVDYQIQIIEDIERSLKMEFGNGKSKNKISDEVLKDITDTISKVARLQHLIEFTRAVHAEMDAITSVARMGNGSLINATLYCTTFPCHICARHIIASGITKVVYIEPYEKSLALDLHSHEIDFDPTYETPKNKVIFLPFEGVAPKQYLNLFNVGERKENRLGKKIIRDMKTASPVMAKILGSFRDFEAKITDNLKELDILPKINYTIES